MAFDKKPSMYSEHGTVGSAEELDAYGVWVKSEPQDFTAGLAEAANFDAEAIPYEADYEADFDAGFSDLGIGDIGLPDYEAEIPEVSEVDFEDGVTSGSGHSNEDASTQLLMKIADELSMIRSELSTLKKEFAGIHVSGAPDAKTEAAHSGFFTEEEDEKIALTGDEMEDILSSADYSGEEELGYDPLREADEAALKELSDQNEGIISDEEINIDFNNLGINLDNELEEETGTAEQEELPPLEAADDDFEVPSFDTLSFDEPTELETEDQLEEASQDFAEELVPLEEDEELRDLRLEGAIPLTPPPDNSGYLEEDPFALDDAPVVTEEPVSEEVVSEEIVSEEPVLEEPVLEEPVAEEPASEEAAPADTIGEDTPDLSFDDVSFDLDFDDFSDDNSLSFEDEADIQSSDVGSGDDKAAAPAESPAPIEEPSTDLSEESSDALDLGSLELSDDIESADDGSLDLSEAVIDEPDLSTEIVEPPLEEPVLGDISFQDDISLDMDDFGATEPPKADEKADNASGAASDADDSLAQVIPEGFEVNAEEAAVSFDDDLEAFTDEDLSIATGELGPIDAPASEGGGGEDINIPSGLKNELKSVLSYMDHLLESLPEDKIEEFAKSEYFDSYKKIFKELGLV